VWMRRAVTSCHRGRLGGAGSVDVPGNGSMPET
jgi:hypothetical protein